jgi:hypothetical protein
MKGGVWEKYGGSVVNAVAPVSISTAVSPPVTAATPHHHQITETTRMPLEEGT